MLTLDTIFKEIEKVPVNRLNDLYSFIHSLKCNTKTTKENRNKILSFSGSFNDMTQKDYDDFIKESTKTRNELFDRNIDL
jgi:hypothetical protein